MRGDCIETPHGNLDKDGYPCAKYAGKREAISRTVMGLLYGRDAIKGKLVCHTCGNRACVNPAHLYIGDPQTNSDDKWRDGTMATGEKHGRFKSHAKTEDIVHMFYNLGMTQQEIGEEVGLTQSSVSGRITRYNKQKGDNR